MMPSVSQNVNIPSCEYFDTDYMDFDLQQENGKNPFTVSANGLMKLSAEVYKTICSVDKNFAAEVSESCFDYYNIMLFWARIGWIRKRWGKAIADEIKLVDYVKSMGCKIVYPIGTYLNGIGNFEDPSGTPYILELYKIPDDSSFGSVAGFYGRVDSNTHYIYESYPAPGVIATRILADVEYTNKKCSNDWNLPQQLRPVMNVQNNTSVDKLKLYPNRNLLGWNYASKLTSKQMEMIQGSLNGNSFVANAFLKRFNLHKNLFQAMSDRIEQLKMYMKLEYLNTSTTDGSICQGMMVQRKPLKYKPYERCMFYLDGQIRVRSSFMADYKATILAVVMAYRLEKDDIDGSPLWSCYLPKDEMHYKNVKDAWCSSKNVIHDFGRVKILNDGDKISYYTVQERLGKAFLNFAKNKKK